MDGFANQLVSGLIGWKSLGHGISILSTTAEQKKAYATISRAYNRKHFPEIIKQIEDSFDDYSSKWTNVPEPMRIKLGLKTPIAEVTTSATASSTSVQPSSNVPPKRQVTGKRGGSSAAAISAVVAPPLVTPPVEKPIVENNTVESPLTTDTPNISQ